MAGTFSTLKLWVISLCVFVSAEQPTALFKWSLSLETKQIDYPLPFNWCSSTWEPPNIQISDFIFLLIIPNMTEQQYARNLSDTEEIVSDSIEPPLSCTDMLQTLGPLFQS